MSQSRAAAPTAQEFPAEALALLGPIAEINDPHARFLAASEAMVTHQAVVNALASLRGHALAELHDQGASFGQLASRTGLTRARIQQLVEASRPSGRAL